MGDYLTFQRPQAKSFPVEKHTHLFSHFADCSKRYTHITDSNIGQMLINIPFTIMESLFAAVELVVLTLETIVLLPFSNRKVALLKDHGKLALSAFLRLFAPLQILTGAPLRFNITPLVKSPRPHLDTPSPAPTTLLVLTPEDFHRGATDMVLGSSLSIGQLFGYIKENAEKSIEIPIDKKVDRIDVKSVQIHSSKSDSITGRQTNLAYKVQVKFKDGSSMFLTNTLFIDLGTATL